jgi:hypothetical protein
VFLYFVSFTAAFAVIVLFMVWYSRFMFQKIYGDMRGQIDAVVSGSTPPEWDERLVKAFSKCRTEEEKDAAAAKHKKFVDRRVMDLVLFMKRTSLVESEAERNTILEQLENFRRLVGGANFGPLPPSRGIP